MDNRIATVFLLIAVAIAAKVLHELYLSAADFKRKTWILSGLAGLWVVTVLALARYFCSFAQTVEQCFRLWSIAFGVGCIGAGFQAFILIICRNKRDIKELDRMKLRDL